MPSKKSMTELQELGRTYYGRKEYQKALDAFTEAIDMSNAPTSSLLDNRAATLEKLEDLQAALRDGKRTIQSWKQDVTGYLRTGKILRMMDKPDVALGIYQYGLRKVSPRDRNIKLLRGMHDKLIRQLSPSKSVDPFVTLPVELIEMIMSYLRFHEMVNCLRVTKHWHHFLTSLPSLWIDLDLLYAKRPVPPKFIRQCVTRSNGKVKRAVIHRLKEDRVLLHLMTKCYSLEELVLLVHAEFRYIYSSGWVAQWLVEQPNLQTLKLGGSDKQVLGSAALDVPALIKKTPNLRTLALCSWKLLNSFLDLDFSVLTKLEHLRLEDFPLNPYPRLPNSLRSLTMDVHRGTSHLANLTHSYLPLLTELELSGCFALVVVQHLQEVIQQRRGSTVVTDAFPSLRKLSLDADTSYNQLQDLEWARNVEELRLQATALTDAVVEQLPMLFPRLTRLDLSRTRVTGVGVKAIVQQLGGQLAWLG
ncbi:hypothetical protein B0A49_09397, partial [Cryomyces minteri]